MIEVVPYKAEHLKELGKLYPEEFKGIEFEQFPKELEVGDLAYTAIDKGNVLGSAGIRPMWPGCGQAWAFLSPPLLKKPFFLHKIVKKYIFKLQEKGRFHRIQCEVLCGYEAGHRWARRLGFMSEGTLHMYCSRKLSYTRFSLLSNY